MKFSTFFKFAAFEAVLVVIAFVIAFTSKRQHDDQVPTKADDEALQNRIAEIARERAETDPRNIGILGNDNDRRVIILSPWWAEGVRLLKLNLPIFSTSQTTVPFDLLDLKEIILVSLEKLPRADVKPSIDLIQQAGFQQAGHEENLGAFTLRRFASSRPTQRVFRATDALDQLQLAISNTNSKTSFSPCTKNSQATHICRPSNGAPPHTFHFSPQRRGVNSKPYRCLALTTAKGNSLRLEFPNVDAGRSFHLVTGPIGQGNLRKWPMRQPLSVQVHLGKNQVANWEWIPGDASERHVVLDDFRPDSDQPSEPLSLTLIIRGDSNHPQEICFEAEAWR